MINYITITIAHSFLPPHPLSSRGPPPQCQPTFMKKVEEDQADNPPNTHQPHHNPPAPTVPRIHPSTAKPHSSKPVSGTRIQAARTTMQLVPTQPRTPWSLRTHGNCTGSCCSQARRDWTEAMLAQYRVHQVAPGISLSRHRICPAFGRRGG